MKLLHDIENDLEHTIPPSGGMDSQRLFQAMTRRSLALLGPGPGETVVDLACGLGQDALSLAAHVPAPSLVLAVEPSWRMLHWGWHLQRSLQGRAPAPPAPTPGAPPRAPDPPVRFVRALGEELPLRSASVDALLCKGALDHFMSPALTLAEVARVLKPGGRVVIALANYDSLSCRLGRWGDARRSRLGKAPGRGTPRGHPATPANGMPPAHPAQATDPPAPPAAPSHPYYEPPPDHLTRFGYRDILALAGPPLRLSRVQGLSLLWCFPPWGRLLASVPAGLAGLLLSLAFAMARLWPSAADVVVIQARKPAGAPA